MKSTGHLWVRATHADVCTYPFLDWHAESRQNCGLDLLGSGNLDTCNSHSTCQLIPCSQSAGKLVNNYLGLNIGNQSAVTLKNSHNDCILSQSGG